MMDGIFIYDWRDRKRGGTGVGVSLQCHNDGNPESFCSCYNVGNLANPFEWDVSIAESMYKLDTKKAYELMVRLAEIVPQLNNFRNILEN